MSRDPRDVVRDGYDAIAADYLEFRQRKPGADLGLLDEALIGLPDGARVLDAGCGAGLPIGQRLAERFAVTGVDISPVQVELARKNVPGVEFIVGDMADLELPDESFDAVVCLFALIHVPRDEHAAVLQRFHRLLRPGGALLVSVGFNDSEVDIDDDWLGAGAPMLWSHFDRETSRRLVREAGYEITWERLVTEAEEFGGGRHPFVLAHRM